MPRTRQDIKDDLSRVWQGIKKLNAKEEALQKENLLFCDEDQRFEEKVERHERPKYQRSPHQLDGKLVGRVFWREGFKDDDTGEIIYVDRERVIRVDGKWLDF